MNISKLSPNASGTPHTTNNRTHMKKATSSTRHGSKNGRNMSNTRMSRKDMPSKPYLPHIQDPLIMKHSFATRTSTTTHKITMTYSIQS